MGLNFNALHSEFQSALEMGFELAVPGETSPYVFQLPSVTQGETPESYGAKIRGMMTGALATATPILLEVPRGHIAQQVIPDCLDPQHGGAAGIFGSITRQVSATEAAAAYVAARGTFDVRSTVFFVVRPDVDAVFAAIALTDAGLRTAIPGIITALDEPMGTRGTWEPSSTPVRGSLSESGSPLAALNCLLLGAPVVPGAYRTDLSLQDRVDLCAMLARADRAQMEQALSPALREFHSGLLSSTRYMFDNCDVRTTYGPDRRGIVASMEYAGIGSLGALYAHAPVAVLTHPQHGGKGWTGRKHTIALDPRASALLFAAFGTLRDTLSALEPGWDGNMRTGIMGSPFTSPSTLDHATVVDIVHRWAQSIIG